LLRNFSKHVPSPIAAFVPIPGHLFPNTPCLGFCFCGGERREKTTPPLRGRGMVYLLGGAFIGSISRIQKIGWGVTWSATGAGAGFCPQV
jgi:hypothetical protein